MRISDWSSDVCSSDLHDNGIGLDDRNFDSFNTAFSPRKSQIGGKGLGRFTWLKAFDQALVKSTFRDDDATLHTRDFVFDQSYDLDERGLPKTATAQARGTTIHLSGLRKEYQEQVPRSVRAEEHTSELQSLMRNQYDVICSKQNTE